jgi:hypothetical protein
MKYSPLVQLLICCCAFGAASSTLAFDTVNAGPKGLYIRDGVLMRQGRPYHGIGANYQLLFARLITNKDDTSSLENLARLGKAGIPFVRFRASGFYTAGQKLYLDNRPEFFRRMDQVVRCAEQNRIGLIPSLFWRFTTVADLVDEQRDQFGNPGSRSNDFIRQFTREMVLRYNNSAAIWGWEFGNEGNLSTDQPNARGRQRKGLFEFGTSTEEPNHVRLTSEQLRTAYSAFAETVRKIDPWRIIETGNSMPRKAAWHNARGQFWHPDTTEQTYAMLLSQNPPPMNMISVHIYQRAQRLYPFGPETVSQLIARLMRVSTDAHKPLFIGEFPTRDRAQTDEFLRAIEDNRVPLSAFWVFDYPAQARTMSVDFHNERAFVVDLVAKANAVLERDAP